MSSDDKPPATPATRLNGRFVDEGQIDKGGMGTIQRLFESALRRRVAMKTLRLEMANPRELQRFHEEARLTASLDHPYIPPVHELGFDEQGSPYFTMKYVEGRTLLAVLRETGFSPADPHALYDVLQIWLKACDAVAFAHSRGLAHCDIKPMNVMVGAHGAVYVMDWGIARPLSAPGSAASKPVGDPSKHVEGTAAYMAPEQANGRLSEIDVRTDVFALGGLLYRILAGRAPYVGEVEAQLAAAREATITPPWDVRRDIALPRKLCEIAMRALAPAPADRFQTVSELHDAVAAYLRGDVEFETAVFEPGTLVCREGDPGHAAWAIVEGHARVFKTFETGRRIIGDLGPGDTFGETAILGSRFRTASVEAIGRLTVRVITRAQLERELGRTYWVGQFVKSLADRFRDVNERAARHAEDKAEAELREEILRFLITRSPGKTETPWMPLRLHLCRMFGRTGTETSSLVARLAGFELDTVADVLRVLPLTRASVG